MTEIPDNQSVAESTGWPPPINRTPTLDNPWTYDGETYSDYAFHVSPEGLVYGAMKRVAKWPHPYWWDGQQYQTVEIVGQAASFSNLPSGPRPFGEIWRAMEFVKGSTTEYIWKAYYWDSEDDTWKPIRWLWNVDAFSDLPLPGFQVGDAHRVVERDVLVFWNGFQWTRNRHSGLMDDEPERHLPPGFLRWVSPDARVVFVSSREIGIEPVEGGTGQVWVNGEYIQAARQCSVLSSLPTLEWDSQNSVLLPTYIEPSTEYWIYLANTLSPEYLIEATGGDGSHAATPRWDFKGKLFLSRSADVNGYLSDMGAGQNARLVGKVQTDDTPASEGGPYFLRELNISIISRTTAFPETYREYSDYQIRFVDYNRLTLALLDGAYGQIYVGGNLEYLGANYDIALDDAWIEWDDSVDGKLIRRTDALSASTVYWIYLAADVDSYNFNAINPDTLRPWTSADRNAESNYVAELDLRLKPFLSTQEPDHGRLSEQWPGYYSRWIGRVATDENGRFVNARDLSAIRQPTLDPTDFDGLAEISFAPHNEQELQIVRSKGTSGVILVGGERIRTYEENAPGVHTITPSDPIWTYTEATINTPLTEDDTIADHPEERIYVYCANTRTLWGDLAEQMFATLSPPVNGYLSRNWPGNQARWICTLVPDSSGLFTGSYIVDGVSSAPVTIDDWSTSLNQVWSSAKVAAELAKVWHDLDLQKSYNAQVNNGIFARLVYLDQTHVKFAPISGDLNIVFPDLTDLDVAAAGISLQVTGSANTLYYCYLSQLGTLSLSTTPPDNEGLQLHTLNNDILVGYVGLDATNHLGGEWSAYSFWNQDSRTYILEAAPTVYLSKPGIVIPPGKTCTLAKTGYSQYQFWCNADTHAYCIIYGGPGSTNCSSGVVYGAYANGYFEVILNPGVTVPAGVYGSNDISLTHSAYLTGCSCYGGCGQGWVGITGNFIFTLEGT